MSSRSPSLARALSGPLVALTVCALLSTPAGNAVATKAAIGVGTVVSDVFLAPVLHQLTKHKTTTHAPTTTPAGGSR